MKFTELNLNLKLQQGIDDAGYTDCLPVQEMTFGYTFEGRDVYVQSQTGTGKTAAFLISIYHQILKDKKKSKRALIVAPTRELAEQIGDEAKLIGRHTGVSVGVFYGGVGYGNQEKMLKDDVDIIVGTPGRLIDFCKSGKLDLRHFSFLIIDEADRLFDMGFLPDLKLIISMMPDKKYRQTMLYSATLDRRVKDIADEYMNDAAEVEIQPEMITVENVTQKLYHVGREEKVNLLLGILKTESPQNAIIFTNTKIKAQELADRLKYNGYDCQYIIGDLPQKSRLDIIDQVKSGKIPILIATDVASRGLHIDDLEMVINYDLPENCESYVHRIGRTARLGKSGKAISLACDKYVYGLEAIESYTKMKIPVHWADDNLYEIDKSPAKTTHYGKKSDRKQRPKGRAESRPFKPERKKTKPEKTPKTAPRGKVKKIKPESPRKITQRNKPDNNLVRPPKNASLDERLAFYSKKYGEDFIVVTGHGEIKKSGGKKSLLKKLVNLIKRK